MQHETDIVTTDMGDIVEIIGVSERGERWLSENVPDCGGVPEVYAEHRHAVDILDGALDAGLVLMDSLTRRTARR